MTTVGAPTRDWLDGPKLVAFLEQRNCPLTDAVLGHHARKVRHWRDGGAASVYEADTVLCKLYMHLHELPDDLWTTSPKGAERRHPGRHRYPPEIRAKAVRLVDETGSVKAAARAIGCDPKAVRDWVRKAA